MQRLARQIIHVKIKTISKKEGGLSSFLQVFHQRGNRNRATGISAVATSYQFNS
jgi:hypothetical protein